MKPILLLALALALTGAALHAETSSADAQKIAELKKSYPMTTCPISGEKLDGDMGKPVDYLYTPKDAAGNPAGEPRLVRFCCNDCLRKFKKNPAPALKALDEATAKKGAAQ